MEKWRLIDSSSEDPRMNLAIEESIAKCVGKKESPPTIRFWENPLSVVIGRHQKVENETNLSECKKENVSILRRFTGGGAVYQDKGNLNCAISLPQDHTLVRESSTLYRILGNALIKALEDLELKARRKSNNIYLNEKKISGMAGAKKNGVVFHHGTLLVNSNISKMKKFLNPQTKKADKKYVQSTQSEVTSLQNSLGRSISIEEIKSILKSSLEKVWEIEAENDGLTEKENSMAKRLHEEKYKTECCIFYSGNKNN